MDKIYNLIMTDEELSYDNHSEDFNIGFFSERHKAEQIAKKYLTEIKGFKDYDVTYKITEKHLLGCPGNAQSPEIFIIYGWNVNNEFDEVDVIESECFSDINAAKHKLDELKTDYCRKEWCIDEYVIDELNWQEGFERV